MERSEPGGAAPFNDSPADVAATIYQALGIAPDTLLHDRQNRPIAVLPAGAPITGILAV